MSWQVTAKIEEFGIGGPDLWQSADITATAYVEREEIWDYRCRTADYGDPKVISTPVFTADLHILSDEANRAYANRLAAMYEADERFRSTVDYEIEAQAGRELERANTNTALAAAGL